MPRPDRVDPDELQALLDKLPGSREPLDVVMLDGYLCGVLLQPEPVPEPQWIERVYDIEGRTSPRSGASARIDERVRRRQAELRDAIARRDWFDPWVYQLDGTAGPSEAVVPWVAGFLLAIDLFPALREKFDHRLDEPLAGMVRHVPVEELDEDDELAALAAEMEPAADLAEAVEDLVSGVLLIADLSQPAPRPQGSGRVRRPAARRGRTR